MAEKGAHVVLAGRSAARMAEAEKAIRAVVPGAELTSIVLDLSSFKSVRAFAAAFLALNLPLHYLFNSAGIMAAPFSRTEDGHEIQFATNALGHFLLTALLVQKLKASAPARVVFVASTAAKWTSVTAAQQRTWSDGDFSMVASLVVNPSENLAEALEILPDERILDVACGSGNIYGGKAPARTYFRAMNGYLAGQPVLPLPATDDRYVNGGRAARIPEVIGRTSDEAQDILSQGGWKSDMQPVDNRAPAGTVVGQRGPLLGGR